MKFYPLEVAKRGLTPTFIPIFFLKVNKYVDTRNVTSAVSSIPPVQSRIHGQPVCIPNGLVSISNMQIEILYTS